MVGVVVDTPIGSKLNLERPNVKLATYLYDNRISCGIVTENGIIDIPTHTSRKVKYHSIKEILNRGDKCMAEVRALTESVQEFLSPADIKLLPPIPKPGKLLALAGNYAAHIKEGGLKLGLSDSPETTTVPRPFIMPPTVVAGTDTKVPWPKYSDQVDYEIELAVMIGKPARCVPPEEALDYAAGYCIANDISARSVTFKENRAQRPWDEFFDWLNGKWSDCFLPIGPWLVTADEIPDPQNLNMTLKVNGEIRQNANTAGMIFSVAQIISFISHIMTLEPGDIIATGTPEGVAMATGNFLKPGDNIECTIEHLGTLSNTMDEKPAAFYTPLKQD